MLFICILDAAVLWLYEDVCFLGGLVKVLVAPSYFFGWGIRLGLLSSRLCLLFSVGTGRLYEIRVVHAWDKFAFCVLF